MTLKKLSFLLATLLGIIGQLSAAAHSEASPAADYESFWNAEQTLAAATKSNTDIENPSQQEKRSQPASPIILSDDSFSTILTTTDQSTSTAITTDIADSNPATSTDSIPSIVPDKKSIHELYLSDEMRAFLADGVTIPILIHNTDATAQNSNQEVIGYSIINLQGNNLFLQDIDLTAPEQSILLTPQVIDSVTQQKGQTFNQYGILVVSDLASLQFDLLKMQLYLSVKNTAFGIKERIKHNYLQPSSSRAISGLINYDINGYTNRSYGKASSSIYTRFDTFTSLAENHLLFSGSTTHGNNYQGKKFTVDQILYTRDFSGYRFSGGMLNSWNMQSLGQVSTLNSQNIYGLSFGNNAYSTKPDQSQLVTPIIIYMPSAGEIRILREDRLLAIQHLSMGNHEIDGSSLPNGIYDIEIETLIGGKIAEKRTYRVNKLQGFQLSNNQFQWQVWGGMMKNSSSYGIGSSAEKYQRPLAGISLASRFNNLEWNTTFYKNDKTLVEEAAINWQLNKDIRVNVQNLFGNDGTRRITTGVNMQLPGNFSTLWANMEKGKKGSDLNYWARDYYSIGSSVELGALIPHAGTLSISYEKNRGDYQNNYLRADYNQTIYSSRYLNAQLQVGIDHNQHYSGGEKTNYQGNYLNLRFSIPLWADINMGVSHDKYGKNYDLSIGKSFNNPINYVSMDLTHSVYDNQNATTSYTGTANFDARYGRGFISLQGDKNSTNYSLSDHGNFVWNTESAGFGNSSGQSAVLINVPTDVDDDDLETHINNQRYTLKSGHNVIILPAFDTYNVSVLSSGLGEHSYDMDFNEKSFTLYPGNVMQISPTFQQMVTIFGRLTTPEGEGLSRVAIKNHIGSTVTDNDGNFSIDVKRESTQLNVSSEETGDFDIDLQLSPKQRGVVWIGELVYDGKNIAYIAPSTTKDETIRLN